MKHLFLTEYQDKKFKEAFGKGWYVGQGFDIVIIEKIPNV